MNEAIQSAMRIKQAQMDRDRSKFLKTNRAMQNTLFHGLYGGNSSTSHSTEPESFPGADNSMNNDQNNSTKTDERIATLSVQLHLLQTSLSALVNQLKAEAKEVGLPSPLNNTAIEEGGEDEQHINDKDHQQQRKVSSTDSHHDPADPSFPLGCNNQTIRAEGHPMQGRLEILHTLHTLERQLRVADNNVEGASITTTSTDTNENNNNTVDEEEDGIAYLRLMFVRTMISNASTLVKDGGKNEVSLAIDLLESGYGIFGYLTPAVDPRDLENDQKENKKGNGGMEAIKDDAVVFHPLNEGVSKIWKQIQTTSSSSASTTATRKTVDHKMSSEEEYIYVANAILTTCGSLISKDAHKPEVARALLVLPKSGIVDDNNSAFSSSATLKPVLTSYTQFGTLVDLICNLALCYAKEHNNNNSNNNIAIAASSQLRDEDSEALLEELLSIAPAVTMASDTVLDSTTSACGRVAEVIRRVLVGSGSETVSLSNLGQESTKEQKDWTTNYQTIDSNYNLRATYLLAKSIGCSVSSTTMDAERAVKILSQAIRIWEPAMELNIEMNYSSDLVPSKNEYHHLMLEKLLMSNSVNSTTNDDIEHSRTHNLTQQVAKNATTTIPSVVNNYLRAAIQQNYAQLKDCIALRDSLTSEIRNSQSKLQKKLANEAQRRQEKEEQETRERKAAIAQKVTETFSISDDTIDSPSDNQTTDERNTSSATKPQIQAATSSEQVAPSSAPLTTTIAAKRNESIEFKMREEVIRIKRALVAAIYKHLFVPVENDEGEEDMKTKRESKSRSRSKKDDVADLATKLENSESRRRVLRYQSLSQQPEAQRAEYIQHINALLKAKAELLNFLCRRLFSQMMLPARFYRLAPFAISSNQSGNTEKEGNTTIAPPPTAKDEYMQWATNTVKELTSLLSLSNGQVGDKDPQSPLSRQFAPITPNLIKILHSATNIGLPLCGPFDPRESNFVSMHSTVQNGNSIDINGNADEAEELFHDAIAAITQPNLMVKQHQNEFMWESWEVRRELRKIVFDFQFPKYSLEEKVSRATVIGKMDTKMENESEEAHLQHHRFALMASGAQQTHTEMEMTRQLFTLLACDEPPSNHNLSMRLSSAVRSILLETAHKVLGTFLGSEEHSDRAQAAIIDAKARKAAATSNRQR